MTNSGKVLYVLLLFELLFRTPIKFNYYCNHFKSLNLRRKHEHPGFLSGLMLWSWERIPDKKSKSGSDPLYWFFKPLYSIIFSKKWLSLNSGMIFWNFPHAVLWILNKLLYIVDGILLYLTDSDIIYLSLMDCDSLLEKMLF